PIQLTRFIGRKRDITAVKRAMTQHRLVTLTGTGGAGKTRLTLEVAAAAADAFKDGVRLVELDVLPAEPRIRRLHSNVPAVARVIQAFATAVGVKEVANTPLLETLGSALSSKNLLLLVDNCEHVRRSCGWLIEKLLRACPDLHILATSRAPLTITGEQEFAVSPLPTFPLRTTASVEARLQSDAVQLFANRARLVSADFVLSAENGIAVARICRRVDGLPFAIELVAAHVRNRSIREIETNLQQLLKSASAAGDGRHRNLETLILWSYDPLSPEAQKLLQRLSVFSGSWTREAACMVCSGNGLGEESIPELLDDLCNVSMVMRVKVGEEYRYRLLETIRDFARDRLKDTEEAGEAQARHLDYFLALAEEAEPHLARIEQQVWLERLEAEHDNFRAALTGGMESEKRFRLAGALGRFWAKRGYFGEGRSWLESALKQSEAVSPDARAKVLNGLGLLDVRQAHYPQARRRLEEALALYARLEDRQGQSEVLNNLSTLEMERGEYRQAQASLDLSLGLKRALNDTWGIAAVLNNMGLLASQIEEYERAETCYRESIALYRTLNNREGVASALANLAGIVYHQENYAEALALYTECLEVFEQIGNRYAEAITLYNLGETWLEMGDLDQAAVYLERSLALRQELGDHGGVAYPLQGLGRVAKLRGNWEEAVKLLARSKVIRDRTGMHLSAREARRFAELLEDLRATMSPQNFSRAWEAESVVREREAGGLG
ncbi:MAG TPA: tetratricopeptide repeat protein, partial [Chthonomonadaceae bacterium]|nr:tetratricopeptide repeat protein [Chthonomonadaceae bacterium]